MLRGVFNGRQSAEGAHSALESRGFSKNDVNNVMSDETGKKHFSDDGPDTNSGNKALETAGKGSAIGGTVCAIIGAVAAIGTSVLNPPGLGLLVAGPIAGGVAGALVGSGIPEDRAKEHQDGVKNGRIVMGVNAGNDEDA